LPDPHLRRGQGFETLTAGRTSATSAAKSSLSEVPLPGISHRYFNVLNRRSDLLSDSIRSDGKSSSDIQFGKAAEKCLLMVFFSLIILYHRS